MKVGFTKLIAKGGVMMYISTDAIKLYGDYSIKYNTIVDQLLTTYHKAKQQIKEYDVQTKGGIINFTYRIVKIDDILQDFENKLLIRFDEYHKKIKNLNDIDTSEHRLIKLSLYIQLIIEAEDCIVRIKDISAEAEKAFKEHFSK